MTARARCDRCHKRKWSKVVAGRGLCEFCIERRKTRKRGGQKRKAPPNAF